MTSRPQIADRLSAAAAALLDAERRQAVGDAIVASYARIPQTDEEIVMAEAHIRRLISEERW